ncbi:MAG: hypothetical protein HOP21_06905 [Methylotenera sp.]|nr:hypothetical protein [Methylotenera sp.]
MNKNSTKMVYLDPSYKAYYEDKLFDHTNLVLNRDDTLAPFIRLRDTLMQQGVVMHTADQLVQQVVDEQVCDYYSLGVLDNYELLKTRKNVSLKAFVIFEPPVVAPKLYQALPDLTAAFKHVYVHNVEGDGYSIKGVDRSKLRKLYWPQPHKDVLLPFWNQEDRLRRMVMINGNHKPTSFEGELYSRRIEALAALAKFGKVDLYGRGWERWWSRNSLWLPYWLHRRELMSIYKGPCLSKYEVLCRYEFALCFENMAMKGYVTEKIFDCLYAGTIPLYLGATDISDLIPDDAYIDCRQFASWEQMQEVLMSMSESKISAIKEAGREFLQSGKGMKYYDALLNIFEE